MKTKTRLKLYLGRKEWTDEHGRPHRVGRPAVVYDSGLKIWKIHGAYHCENGFALEHPNGRGQYYLFGEEYDSLEEVQQELSTMSESTYNKKCRNLTKVIPIEMRRLPKKRNQKYKRKDFQPIKIETVSNYENCKPEVIKR